MAVTCYVELGHFFFLFSVSLHLPIIVSTLPFCSFLAKRGVREDIATLEARNITPEIRQSVEELLSRNKASFDPKVS